MPWALVDETCPIPRADIRVRRVGKSKASLQLRRGVLAGLQPSRHFPLSLRRGTTPEGHHQHVGIAETKSSVSWSLSLSTNTCQRHPVGRRKGQPREAEGTFVEREPDSSS